MVDLLTRLRGVAQCGNGWTARCPAHDDQHSSLSVHRRDGRWLLKCHAGCKWQDIVDALGLEPQALFDEDFEGGGDRPLPTTAQRRNR
jgi:putative DNA primase/helicase